MHNGGFSHRRVNHSIIVRLMQRFRQTGNVTDRPRAGKPRKTTPREDRLISRRARQRPFSTAGALRGNLAFGGHIGTRTVIRRLHHQEMRARRRSCKGLAPTKHFISGQPHFGHNCFWGWGVTVWGCFSFYSKMDWYVLDGNLTGQKYRDNVLAPRVVLYFDNHMRWLTGQCSLTTTLGHIEPEMYNIFYSKRLFRQFHGCDVARHEPYRACMGLYWPNN